MTSIVARKGDLTKSTAQVVVNAGNTSLWLGSGVAGAIRIAGGDTIQEELNRVSNLRQPRRKVRALPSYLSPVPTPNPRYEEFTCDLGEVVVTHGGNLHAKMVFHAAVMDCKGPHKAETSKDIIYESTKNCMLTARQYGVHGMAIPIFGTGVGGMDPQAAIDAMLAAIKNYPISDFRIRMYGYSDDMYKLILKSIRR